MAARNAVSPNIISAIRLGPDGGRCGSEITLPPAEPRRGEIPPAELAELLTTSPCGPASKQEQEFATVALLIRGGHLSERMVRRMLKSWTPFGIVPVREILLQSNRVTEEILAAVEIEAREWFQAAAYQQSGAATGQTAAQRTVRLMEALDPGGNVAKLFGFSQIPKAAVDKETRSFRSRFRLIRKIGQGGLGTVWLAVDTSLNRYVAVKEIRGQHGRDVDAIARFRREAEITGRLDHPSIVPIHLLCENEEDGRIFYVMRFLGNETLADAIRDYHDRRQLGQNNSLEFHRLLTAFVSICQAVAYAHSNHVIHRDLKPQNVALDSFGQVIVLDWGLAKTLGMPDPQTHLQEVSHTDQVNSLEGTLSAQVMGSPRYMAPEQAAGRTDDVDERTDVYGLGAILFSILTGYAPHELSQESLAPGSKMGHLLDAIVNGAVSRPRSINPKIPRALEAICLMAIAKDQHARYPSASALSDDVQRWLANEPVSALQDPLYKRIQRWMTKHRRLSRGLSLLATILLTAMIVLPFSSYQAGIAAEQLRQQTRSDALRALRSKLNSEVATLSEDTRFIASLLPSQGVVAASDGVDSETSAELLKRLRTTYRNFLDMHPGYTAINYWGPGKERSTKPSRVENAQAQRGGQWTDYTEFFGRHLPTIEKLAHNDIYVGVPGRLAKGKTAETGTHPPHDSQASAEPIGRCLVAGVPLHDEGANATSGGVALECDLERILFDQFNGEKGTGIKLFLTDHTGRCTMQFTRELGLYPVAVGEFSDSMSPLIHAYFTNPRATDVLMVSTKLYAAKISLNPNRPDDFMGIIMQTAD